MGWSGSGGLLAFLCLCRRRGGGVLPGTATRWPIFPRDHGAKMCDEDCTAGSWRQTRWHPLHAGIHPSAGASGRGTQTLSNPGLQCVSLELQITCGNGVTGRALIRALAGEHYPEPPPLWTGRGNGPGRGPGQDMWQAESAKFPAVSVSVFWGTLGIEVVSFGVGTYRVHMVRQRGHTQDGVWAVVSWALGCISLVTVRV